MTLSYIDLLVTGIVVAVVLYAAHRLGQVNPVGTGRLANRLSAVERKVATLDTKIDGQADALEVLSNTAADTATSLSAMRVELASDRGLTERTWSAVDRLQHYFIEDAFKRRGEP